MATKDLLNKFVSEFALAEHLNQDILRCLRVFQVASGIELYTQADEQLYLYFLVAGEIQVNHYHPNGKLSVLAILTPLAVIGDLELFSFDRIKTNVITTHASTLLGIEKAFVMRYGYDDPRFLRFIIHNLTSKLYRTSLLHTSTVLPLVNRFAAYLLEQSAAGGDVVALVPKTYLAGLLGSTSRHLNRIIKTLEAEGSVRVEKRGLRILDRQKLEKYAEV